MFQLLTVGRWLSVWFGVALVVVGLGATAQEARADDPGAAGASIHCAVVCVQAYGANTPGYNACYTNCFFNGGDQCGYGQVGGGCGPLAGSGCPASNVGTCTTTVNGCTCR